MIDPNELMIGNYVYPDNNHGDIVQVCAQDFESTEYLDPIPLTEQWLIDLGVQFGWENYDIEYIFQKYSLRYRYDVGSSAFITSIKYVHQLQNLYFALTDKQLKK